MKVLVTGGCGFIGSHVVETLVKNNHEVSIIDNLSTGKGDNISENIKKNVTFYRDDITEKNNLESIFNNNKYEIVFHLAAQSYVEKSVKDSLYDQNVNIKGSLNLFEVCSKHNVKKIIYSNSGGACYGDPLYLPMKEDHPRNPLSPYAISKNAVEDYLKFYSNNYGIKYTSLRYANVYGPRQDPYGEGGVIAIFINKLSNNEMPNIYGTGNQTRDFIYVKDVAKINLLCLDKADNKILNVGTGKETNVNEILKILKNILGSNIDPNYCPERKGEVFRSSLNIEKLKNELNFSPKYTIENGLKEAVEYFKNN